MHEDKLIQWLQDFETTDNIYEAIFMLDDGSLVSGEFDMGMRGLDHNCIMSLAPDNLNHVEKWEFIHTYYNIVRLVPETSTALIDNSQELTDIQKEMLAFHNYEIERY